MKLPRFMQGATVFAVLGVFLAGCDGDEPVRSQYSLSADEAAVIIANAFGSGGFTYGFTGQMEDLAGVARSAPAGSADTVTLSRAKAGGTSYLYALHVVYGFAASDLDVTCGATGTYTTPTMVSQETTYVSLRFAGLAGDTLTASGYSWRLGSEEATFPSQKSFRDDIVATFDDLRIAKIAQRVLFGTVTFTMRERFPDGVVISLPGTWTYLDNRQAALVVSGRAYTVEIDTGTVLEK